MIEHIGLILLSILSFAQTVYSISAAVNSRIMPRCNAGCTEFLGFIEKSLEFNIAVADDTRIRRSSAQILVKKIIDDRMLKHCRKIHNIMWDPEYIRHTTCIIHTAQRTAAAVVRRCIAILIRKTHGNAYDFVSLLHEQRRSQRTVDPAAHCDHNTLLFHYLLH